MVKFGLKNCFPVGVWRPYGKFGENAKVAENNKPLFYRKPLFYWTVHFIGAARLLKNKKITTQRYKTKKIEKDQKRSRNGIKAKRPTWKKIGKSSRLSGISGRHNPPPPCRSFIIVILDLININNLRGILMLKLNSNFLVYWYKQKIA